jgi:hypothetical protein
MNFSNWLVTKLQLGNAMPESFQLPIANWKLELPQQGY